MDMLTVREKAREEGMRYNRAAILGWLNEQRKVLRNKGEKARDVRVPTEYLYAIEEVADKQQIPIHHVCNSTFSIALTYSDLLMHENLR